VDSSSSLVAAKVSSRPVRSGELGAAQRGNKGNDAQTLTERKGRRERFGRAIERRGVGRHASREKAERERERWLYGWD
jgi:hypothetical protein